MISTCRFWILISRLNLLVLLLLVFPARTYAQQPVLFRSLSGHEQETALNGFLEFNEFGPGREIAEADLNDDGLSEYIVKLDDQSLLIVAMPSRRVFVQLGHINSASGLQVADQHDFGVRQLMTRGTRTNDFARIVYQWNPWKQRYEKQE